MILLEVHYDDISLSDPKIRCKYAGDLKRKEKVENI